ncbi:MAG: TerB family tellurite resistance protein [Myxococcota bacterium]
MAETADSLLDRVVASIAGTPSSSEDAIAADGPQQKSILGQAAASYARKPAGAEATIPTGFDPRAASLFEAVVEAAFLVANADGIFDAAERETFIGVVHEACANTVQRQDVDSLVADLGELLAEDGLGRRIDMVASVVQVAAHKLEVLRIAALMAWSSGGLDASERDVIDRLAVGFRVSAHDLEAVVEQARLAIAG